ncbi:hypothetical protein ACVWWQ_000336 [Rhodanobacter sp. TND4EL1]
MKRYINQLLEKPRTQFESASARRRNEVPGSLTANAGLRAEDGYDWLRQIRPARDSQRIAP